MRHLLPLLALGLTTTAALSAPAAAVGDTACDPTNSLCTTVLWDNAGPECDAGGDRDLVAGVTLLAPGAPADDAQHARVAWFCTNAPDGHLSYTHVFVSYGTSDRHVVHVSWYAQEEVGYDPFCRISVIVGGTPVTPERREELGCPLGNPPPPPLAPV